MDRRNQLTDLNLFGNQVATDAELSYLIRPQGNLMLRASNRLNNRSFLNPSEEDVSAFGLIYRQEFDTVGEFVRRLLNRPQRKEYYRGEIFFMIWCPIRSRLVRRYSSLCWFDWISIGTFSTISRP